MIGVEQWAEIRRLYFVEKRSKRAIHRLTGLHRDTITRALAVGGAAAVWACAGGVEAGSVPGVDLRAAAGGADDPVAAAA